MKRIKTPSIVYCCNGLINFSVYTAEKLICKLNCEILWNNFFKQEDYCFMINQILTAIDNVVKRKDEFLISKNAFSRIRKWSLDRNVKFQIFRERTTTRHDINTFCLNSSSDNYVRITRGNYSRRRMLILPELYKEINQEYLKQIKFNQNLSIYKTYKGFRILAVDGLTLSFDNNKELRKDFEVKGGNLNYRNPSEVKFTAIMDVLNGFILLMENWEISDNLNVN